MYRILLNFHEDYFWEDFSNWQEIDGLLVPPSKAYTLLTDHLITGKPLGLSLHRKLLVKPYIHISPNDLLR